MVRKHVLQSIEHLWPFNSMKLLNAKNKITFDFHPKAAVNFNNKADAFVKRLCVISNAEDQKTELFKDTPTSLILKEDGIQFLNRSTIDSKSNETSTHFFEDPNWLGFAEQDYAYFRSFCLDVSQVGPLKCKTSIEFILKMSLSWIQKKHNDSNYNIQYTEYIKKCCEEEVFSRTVIFPIDGLYVQASFTFGPFEIYHCGPDEFESLFPILPGEPDEIRERSIKKYRQTFQGKPIASVSIVGDEEYVEKEAIKKVDRVIPILNLFMGFPLNPEIQSFIAPTGMKPRPYSISVLKVGGEVDSTIEKNLAVPNDPVLTQDTLDYLHDQYSFGQVHELINNPDTQFKKIIADSLRLMGLGCYEENVSNRLIYTLISLESLFLKNSSEPIQDNVAYRISICCVDDPTGRQSITSNFKVAYNLRSTYIHHGEDVETIEELTEFFHWAWIALLSAVRNAKNFETKERFLEQIDYQKYT